MPWNEIRAALAAKTFRFPRAAAAACRDDLAPLRQ